MPRCSFAVVATSAVVTTVALAATLAPPATVRAQPPPNAWAAPYGYPPNPAPPDATPPSTPGNAPPSNAPPESAPPSSAPPGYAPPPGSYPPGYAPYGPGYTPYGPGYAPTPRRRPFAVYGSVGIGVPLFLDQDLSLYRPGANLRFEGGIDFGIVAPFLDFGFRWTPIDFDNWARNGGDPSYAGFGRSPLRSFYFGLGARLQIPDLRIAVPYLSGAFDLNFWNFDESVTTCGAGVFYWGCTTSPVYHFTPGFTGRVGSAFKLTEHFFLDVGFALSMSFPGDFFDTRQKWVEPFLAFTHHR